MDEVTNLEVSGVFMNATDAQATIGALLAAGSLAGAELDRLLKAKNHLDDFVKEMGEFIKGTPL